ncbi:Putative DNA-binding protein in cluster with Type I restriction-modification system [uncultured Gammaproteobacteria bacterium]|nr:Putative DNA-binding protein in cluster with Type I restriction-modification system [Bathymodiolus brooksi thiotrophic gill symbiont]CAC9602121.1 Putative DNA-binding protein in cluster with Type I restriction-modification system [uncultured Gammaproteobacteria bacterium]CAC9624518.1 Putative DNA-binding protein in cluster with Type I restriction-modification system [uncultured Gammaproteobacteria bacterium]
MNELTEFLLYTGSDGDVKVETYLHNETLWLSQAQIASLFGVQRPAIGKHLKNIFESGELNEKVVCSILELPTQHGAIIGKTQNTSVKYYNLDAILSVGYRVNSNKATQFRIWATTILKEFIIKGFAMDDDRLKNGKHFGQDYFKELLEKVRSIRSSERRIYQQITDIFAECSIDYSKNAPITKRFFANVQNKFHYAITGQTAAEIIYTHADKSLPHMGLKTWKNAPKGRILKSDVGIAKNYLTVNEIKGLEKAISSYFDYIEIIIDNRTTMTMQDLADSVDKFLNFNEYKILKDLGIKTKQQAQEKVDLIYDEFNKTQKINSDFDKMIKKIKDKNKSQP